MNSSQSLDGAAFGERATMAYKFCRHEDIVLNASLYDFRAFENDLTSNQSRFMQKSLSLGEGLTTLSVCSTTCLERALKFLMHSKFPLKAPQLHLIRKQALMKQMPPSKKKYPMKPKTNIRSHIDDLRGTSRLATEATLGICDLVEAMHGTIASGPRLLGYPLQRPTRAVITPIYGCIRGVTSLVGASIDGALAQLTGLLGTSDPASHSPSENALFAVLNGVLGDYLQETGNPLAIPMQLRHGGARLVLEPKALRSALPEAGPKLLLLVHGSCMSDRQWLRGGHDHGTGLSRELGYTPVYLRYNTGLHVSTNGREFAALLDQLVTAWPVPLQEIVILAHSMGGLVARSACHIAEERGYSWRTKLRTMIFLGTPHHGAPLERLGNWVDQLLVISRYSAPFARLGKIRSAGVTDMRYGNVLEEHWQGRDRFAHGKDTRTPIPLPTDVACYTIAATKSRVGTKKLSGDGIVPMDSALGLNKIKHLSLAFPEAHQRIAYETNHLDLLNRSEVYLAIRQWLGHGFAATKRCQA